LSNSASSCADRDVRKDGVFDIVGSRGHLRLISRRRYL
jgi:hypothetical protein